MTVSLKKNCGMDTLFRKENYLEYIQKLNNAKKEISDDINMRGATLKINQILTDLKEETEGASMYMLVLIVPILLIAILSIIKFGFTFRLAIVGLVVAYFIFYRSGMQQVVSAVKPLEIDENYPDGKGALLGKIEYIKQGIDVKQKRLGMIRGLYASFFPILMVMVAEYILGPYSLTAFLVSIVMAFIVGGYFWYKYFAHPIEDLEYTRDELLVIQNELITQS